MPESCPIEEMTNEKCQEMILTLGFARDIDLNPISGVPGNFYKEHRAEDIKQLVLELLEQS